MTNSNSTYSCVTFALLAQRLAGKSVSPISTAEPLGEVAAAYRSHQYLTKQPNGGNIRELL